MLNQTALIGKIVNEIELRKTQSGQSVVNVLIAVERNYEESDGSVGVDYIECTLWSGLAESIVKHCKKGEMIAVKGRLNSRSRIVENKKVNSVEVIAERINFFSYNK